MLFYLRFHSILTTAYILVKQNQHNFSLQLDERRKHERSLH